MNQASIRSFMRFLIGFAGLIVASFGLAIAVSSYTQGTTVPQAAAAVLVWMVR